MEILKKNDFKVSIIIPIHNSERFLRNCMKSVMLQSLTEIEILCIDGGSTDSSVKIVEELQREDDRIVLIEDPNTSYGHKLNIGIDRARGTYVAILESDDTMDFNMLRSLYKVAEEYDVDIVDSDYYEFFLYKNKIYRNIQKKYPNSRYYNHLIHNTNSIEKYMPICGIWTALYRKAFLIEERILLNESPGASYQDTSFLFLTSLLAETVYHLEIPFYHYRVDNLDSSVKDDRKIFEIVGECEFLKNNLTARNIQDKNDWKLYCIRKYTSYLWNYSRLSPEAKRLFLKSYLEELKQDVKTGLLTRNIAEGSLYNSTFLLLDDKGKFEDLFSKDNRKTLALALYSCFDKIENKDIIIFGAGILGSRLLAILQQHQNRVKGICDNSETLHGANRNGFTVISVEEAVKQYEKAVYLVVSQNYAQEMKEQLIKEGIDKENIIIFI